MTYPIENILTYPIENLLTYPIENVLTYPIENILTYPIESILDDVQTLVYISWVMSSNTGQWIIQANSTENK